MTAPIHQIRMLLLDVDGTLTDGGIYLSASGEETKKFNAKDGIGIKRAMKAGVHVGFISAAVGVEVVRHRARMLGVPFCYVGEAEKITILRDWAEELNVPLENAAFIGDDVNDRDIMDSVGFSACPADAVSAIKEVAQVILEKSGGDGCVREFIDRFILEA